MVGFLFPPLESQFKKFWQWKAGQISHNYLSITEQISIRGVWVSRYWDIWQVDLLGQPPGLHQPRGASDHQPHPAHHRGQHQQGPETEKPEGEAEEKQAETEPTRAICWWWSWRCNGQYQRYHWNSSRKMEEGRLLCPSSDRWSQDCLAMWGSK